MDGETGPGGFLPPILPSPPPSSAASTATTVSALPNTRRTPLKPGSQKQSTFIQFVDEKLLHISRRYEKRSDANLRDPSDEADDAKGYADFGEMALELEAALHLVWVSGTPSLQIPYLLTIALTTCTCLPSFPFAPRRTFSLLNKLDLAFVSLLKGEDPQTGDQLPGFEGGRAHMSTTEKVRLRGIVERTRVTAVSVAAKTDDTTDTTDNSQASETDGDMTTDDDSTMEGLDIPDNHGRWEMEIARVYEKTIVELGESF